MCGNAQEILFAVSSLRLSLSHCRQHVHAVAGLVLAWLHSLAVWSFGDLATKLFGRAFLCLHGSPATPAASPGWPQALCRPVQALGFCPETDMARCSSSSLSYVFEPLSLAKAG